MILVDVHAHLDHKLFNGKIDEIIQNSIKNNVKAIITNGINPETNRIALELAEKYDIVKAALGVYPIDSLNIDKKKGFYPIKEEKIDVDKEIEFIKKNKDKIIAVGEVGLDYYWDKDHKKEQKEVFEKFIQLAEKIKKPIIVHSRKAEADTVELLSTTKLKSVVMHCFSGNFKLVKQIYDKGWSFSIPANIVKSHHFQKIVSDINIAQLLTETDAPFLSPYPDKINQPSYIIETIKKIAEIKEMDKEEVANNIFMNYQKMFL
jgi:TatD DNase family protein